MKVVEEDWRTCQLAIGGTAWQGREGCSSGKAGLTETLWGAGTFLVPRGSGSLWYQLGNLGQGGYLLSACFLKCEMGTFTSQQTVVFFPHALPTLPSWVFTLWVSWCPLISSLLSCNRHDNLQFMCILPVCNVYICAYFYVCIYRFYWSIKFMFTDHKRLF